MTNLQENFYHWWNLDTKFLGLLLSIILPSLRTCASRCASSSGCSGSCTRSSTCACASNNEGRKHWSFHGSFRPLVPSKLSLFTFPCPRFSNLSLGNSWPRSHLNPKLGALLWLLGHHSQRFPGLRLLLRSHSCPHCLPTHGPSRLNT